MEVEPTLRLSAVGSENLENCQLTVLLTAHDDLEPRILTSVMDGLIFLEGEGAQVIAGGRGAFIAPGRMREDEKRSLQFPCRVDKDTQLSGEYVIQVVLTEADSDKPLAEERTVAYIQREAGLVRFLTSERDFERELIDDSDKLRRTDFRVKLALERAERPKIGLLTVQVIGKEDGFNPDIRIDAGTNAGIRFLATDYANPSNSGFSVTARPGPMAASGSRILNLPFQINPDGFEGLYALDLVLIDDRKETVDRLPQGIALSKTGLAGGDAWLSIVSIDD